MQQMSADWLTDITAPSRIVEAKVEVYRDSALVYTFLPDDILVSIQIGKATERGKIFGYTVCQVATVEIIDSENSIELQKDDALKIYLGTEAELANNPTFYIEEIKKDEVRSNVSIVAYDSMNKATKYKQSDLTISYPITMRGYGEAVAAHLGLTARWVEYSDLFSGFEYQEEIPPNFSGEETLRQVLIALAEARGVICFIDKDDKLCFKRINSLDEAVLEIKKEDYFEFNLGEIKPLTNIIYTNVLGDTITYTDDLTGYSYVIRDNPFLDALDEDVLSLFDCLAEAIESETFVFTPYTIKWRGNPALELGDVVSIEKKDDNFVNVFYLGETLIYNGGLVVSCDLGSEEDENADTPPITIGDALSKTSAKIDKVNDEIILVAGSVEENATNISNLTLTAEDITASVQQIETVVDEGLTSLNDEITTLSKKVELGVTAEDVKIAISSELANGVDKVTTSTGYTFNQDGLTVSKSTSDITTTITEDGMRVDRGGETVLTANNEGVQAEDLHATTYLIIGANSRFEDFGSRTGCFWIG